MREESISKQLEKEDLKRDKVEEIKYRRKQKVGQSMEKTYRKDGKKLEMTAENRAEDKKEERDTEERKE